MKLIILIAMLFCHCIADYNVQGILANLKQKSWWKENAPDEMYKHDWIIALIEHSFVWTCFVFIPIVIYYILVGMCRPLWWCVVLFVVSCASHAYTDHLKANKHEINLLEDQILHIIDVVGVWACCILV